MHQFDVEQIPPAWIDFAANEQVANQSARFGEWIPCGDWYVLGAEEAPNRNDQCINEANEAKLLIVFVNQSVYRILEVVFSDGKASNDNGGCGKTVEVMWFARFFARC